MQAGNYASKYLQVSLDFSLGLQKSLSNSWFKSNCQAQGHPESQLKIELLLHILVVHEVRTPDSTQEHRYGKYTG